MDMLDFHAKNLKLTIKSFGVAVVLTEPDGLTTHSDLRALFNDVEHALKFDNIEKPMGEKASLYFDTDTLFTRGISPNSQWKATCAPNKYEDDKTYVLEIPKEDKQLPGKLFFLSEDLGNVGWDEVTN